ncbi:MAG: rod shape-determining protein RodA, partial [Candidatus Omnitrophica bacterium]|nr:rod shape-determining protein RodA [Candidatus Omnitrophota bacterium]
MLLRWFKDTYWPLVTAFLGLIIVSLFFVFSASLHDSGNYQEKHVIWLAISFATLMLVPFLGYRTFLSISYLLYGVSVLMLLWVFVAGESRLGAQRWITLGPLVLQPSEFAKISTILALANFLGSHPIWERAAKVLLTASGLALLPVLLIMKQPDLGSAITFFPVLVILLFLWGIRYRILLLAVGSGLLFLPLAWNFLKEYQKKRILVFLDPQRDPLGAGYTALQSKIAVGSGGLFGKGYLAGTQSQLQFVPEHHTDFIF